MLVTEREKNVLNGGEKKYFNAPVRSPKPELSVFKHNKNWM